MSSLSLTLPARRDAVIDALSELFATDVLELAEFERRLALAHRAEDVAALDAILADLPKPTTDLVPDRVRSTGGTELVPAEAAPTRKMLALFGVSSRRGVWTPPRHLLARAVFGSVELDFRDAQLAPGATDLTVYTYFGSIDVIVPPHLPVEVDGLALFGSFDHLERAPSRPDEREPRLRIRGRALFGSVEVQTRLPNHRLPPPDRR